jgi:hypothetical protein
MAHTEDDVLKALEISASGQVMAAHIGDEIFIRALNQARRRQVDNTEGYLQSISFMPVYLDEDYNHANNVALHEAKLRGAAHAGIAMHDQSKDSLNTSMKSVILLHNLPELERILKLYDDLWTKNKLTSLYVKNTKLLEMLSFVNTIM